MIKKINGWLVIDKPAGLTSTAVLNEIKRFIQAKQSKTKVGHAGTLDPFATGILMVALGEATKTIEYAMDSTKVYEFSITWGESRDTLDIDGKVTETADKIPTISEIKSVLPRFVGPILQLPPQYSALKVNGERAYDLARRGIEVELKPREVTCYKLELLDHFDKQSQFRVECSKGFYVRALARDIAASVNALGYVSALRRTQSGKFGIKHAISLASLKELLYTTGQQGLSGVLNPVSAVLDGILVQQLSLEDAKKLLCGQRITNKNGQEGLVLAINDKTEVAICKASNADLIPLKTFNILAKE
jgi:tRNA pseudouridine55 synthase